jgi:hypothetical protein
MLDSCCVSTVHGKVKAIAVLLECCRKPKTFQNSPTRPPPRVVLLVRAATERLKGELAFDDEAGISEGVDISRFGYRIQGSGLGLS